MLPVNRNNLNQLRWAPSAVVALPKLEAMVSAGLSDNVLRNLPSKANLLTSLDFESKRDPQNQLTDKKPQSGRFSLNVPLNVPQNAPVLRKIMTVKSLDNIRYTAATRQNVSTGNVSNIGSGNESISAGVPILELVRKLEDENVINRDDRLALNEALNDPERRDFVVISLQDIELSSNLRFAVRRLKMLIHQNPAGMPAPPADTLFLPTKQREQELQNHQHQQLQQLQQPLHQLTIPIFPSHSASPKTVTIMVADDDSPDYSPIIGHSYDKYDKSHQKQQQQRGIEPFSPYNLSSLAVDDSPLKSQRSSGNNTKKKRKSSYDGPIDGISMGEHTPRIVTDALVTITTLVGDAPVYCEPGCYGVCSKISSRLHDFNVMEATSPNKGRQKKFAVLVGSGSCNPLTRMHMRSFFLAKQYLESQVGYVVLGSILSPSHGVTVRERYRNHPTEIIPSPHRLAVAQLMVQSSKWLSVDPWEITRRRAMDYMSVLQHCRETLTEGFPGIEIKIVYICKENMVPKISPQAMRQENFGCISVCR